MHHLTRRQVDQVRGLGVRAFALLFDDISSTMHADDVSRFGGADHAFAAAQCHVANALHAHLAGTAGSRLLLCPTEYCAARAVPSMPASPYLRVLGAALHPAIGVFWTGPDIISDVITPEHVVAIGAILQRKPVLWDNLHANDYDVRRAYLGPYGTRRDLAPHIDGVLSNPNCQFTLNFAPLHTLATWARDPAHYEPQQALRDALAAWLPHFQAPAGHDPVTLDDVQLIVDVMHLPHRHGPRAAQLLADVAWLARTEPTHPAYPDALQRVRAFGQQLGRVFEKLTEIDDRALCYDLYAFLWGPKELGIVLQLLCDWLPARQHHPAGFRSIDHLPGTYEGGFAAQLQALVPFNNLTGMCAAAVRTGNTAQACLAWRAPARLWSVRLRHSICRRCTACAWRQAMLETTVSFLIATAIPCVMAPQQQHFTQRIPMRLASGTWARTHSCRTRRRLCWRTRRACVAMCWRRTTRAASTRSSRPSGCRPWPRSTPARPVRAQPAHVH